jgi:simple sugar transport system permease protein
MQERHLISRLVRASKTIAPLITVASLAQIGWAGSTKLGKALVSIAILLGASLFLLIYGVNPLAVYREILVGSMGSLNAIAETLNYAAPILLTALAAIVCFRCSLWNIGAEGQLYLGAIATAGLGLQVFNLPAAVVLPLIALGAFAAGSFWAAIPAVLKLRFGASEIIVTIMMNFLAVILATYLISGVWGTGTTPVTRPIQPEAHLPILIPGTRLHANLIVSVAAAALLALVIRATVFGYHLRAIGMNARAAEVAGISVKRVSFTSFLIAGGVAGLAGFGQVAGIHHALPGGFSPGFGYTGIAVAMLGGLDPLWSIVSAFFLAALNVGGQSMQRALGVPVTFVSAIEGILLLALLASGALKRP